MVGGIICHCTELDKDKEITLRTCDVVDTAMDTDPHT